MEAIFKGQKNKRRRGSQVESIKGGVEELLAHMEVAAERDMEAIKEGRPAFLKFKMLKEVSMTPFKSSEGAESGIGSIERPAGTHGGGC